jgi:predicted amino acid-binding ACT domain protein
MGIIAKRVRWWAGKIEDRAGGVAAVLEPLSKAGVSLEFLLARRAPEEPGRGIVFAAPILGEAAERAAAAAGLQAAPEVAALRVEGPDRAGIGYAIVRAVADAHISIRGLSASVIGDRFVCYFAFDSAADADRAADVVTDVPV